MSALLSDTRIDFNVLLERYGAGWRAVIQTQNDGAFYSGVSHFSNLALRDAYQQYTQYLIRVKGFSV